jgi:hypothetical protein
VAGGAFLKPQPTSSDELFHGGGGSAFFELRDAYP